MKNGDIVSVKDTDIVGEVVSIIENKVEIKLQNGTSILKLEDEVKRKKKCVCGMSKSFPACDGSHSGQ
jgi:CDGSH-type Zn-finger protein